MDSDSKKQLIFTSAQTLFVKAVILLFFLTTATFIFLYSKTEFTIYMLPKMIVYTLFVVTSVVCFILSAIVIRNRYIKPLKIAEEALKKAHDSLEIKVQQRTAELTQINDELSKSKEKYKLLFTHAPVGIYGLDFISGRFTSVNDVMCSYTGYTRKELLSIVPYSLLTESGQEIISKRLQKVFRGEKVTQNVEVDIIDKNGSRFSALLNTSYVYKGSQVTGSRVVVYDISERKIAEKALKKSEERFRNLVESTSDWIWELNQKALFIYNSPSVELITGYTPADLLGTRYLDYFPQREQENFLMNFRQAIASGTSLPTIECKIVHKTGKLLTVEARGVLSFDKKGNPTGARGICRDITEKKKIDAKKAELQKVLERAKKMEALGLLAGGVAHDLNNILSGVINYPELILLDLPEDSKVRSYVQAIYLSGKRAAEIVDDLITVASGAARTQEPINFNTIVNEYLLSADYSSLITRYPSVKIHMNPDQDLSHIKGSQVQVRKALLNLVINAVEAVSEEGFVLISTQNVLVDSTIKGYDDIPPGDYVVLSVEDTGGGIEAEDMERIFEPFYSKKVMGRSGTGLGLAIVWSTVVDHDGHIDIRSSEKGTIFALYFPTSQSETISNEPVKHIDSYRGNGEKILVVDDEFVQREIACQLLETLRYSSVSMESGEKAVEYLKNESADLILLDMMMDPGMNGRKTFEKIIEIHPNQKVIIASGFADTTELRKAQDQGAGAFLKKPYTIEELGTLIKRQLNG